MWASLLTESTKRKDCTGRVFVFKGSGCLSLFVRCCQKWVWNAPSQVALFAMGKVGSRYQHAFKSQQYTKLAVKKGMEAAFKATGICRIWTEVFTHHLRHRAAGKALQTQFVTNCTEEWVLWQIHISSTLHLENQSFLSTLKSFAIQNILHCHFNLLHFTSDWPLNAVVGTETILPTSTRVHPTTRFQQALQPHGRVSTFGWQQHHQMCLPRMSGPYQVAIWSHWPCGAICGSRSTFLLSGQQLPCAWHKPQQQWCVRWYLGQITFL